MRTFHAEVATQEAFELAEGPVWDAEAQRLLWVDIPNARVLCAQLEGDAAVVTDDHQFAGTAGAVVPTSEGGLLVALKDRFGCVTADGEVVTGSSVVPAARDARFNDGACDPAGRFLVGTMALDDQTGQEHLYRLEADGSTGVIDADLTLSNGLGWAPDGRTLYHIDSVPALMWVRDYDPDTGRLGPRHEHLRIDDGTPDGMCVDAEGNLWVAIWGRGQIRCFDADRRQVAQVEVPAPHTSSAAFVGPNLDRLLITTARKDLSAADLAASPLSGHLFLADVGMSGMQTPAWAGRCDVLT